MRSIFTLTINLFVAVALGCLIGFEQLVSRISIEKGITAASWMTQELAI